MSNRTTSRTRAKPEPARTAQIIAFSAAGPQFRRDDKRRDLSPEMKAKLDGAMEMLQTLKELGYIKEGHL